MKKKLLYFFIFFIVIIILICFIYYKAKGNRKNIASGKVNEFIVNNILYYSSANAISNTTNYQNPEWNLKVFQYTDIAIYLDRLNQVNEDNYITSLEISNIKLAKEDNELYYINPKLIGNNSLDLDSKIEDKLEYTVINDENSENTQNYNIPIFYQDCSNPITLRFINYLNNNYKVPSERSLTYNGSLIRELGLTVQDLDNKISFDLNITVKSGREKSKTLELEIPFEKGKKSILDGDFEIKLKQNIEF